MKKVVLPKKVTFNDGQDKNQGSVVVEPCFPGYGTTLGNGIRRVLLSSLPGAAVVGVKIKGAEHEFGALDNVKEDVLEIILNLKKLRMKIFNDDENEVIKLELKANGEKKVTAKDIAKNSQVEIINENLHIAEITDKNASFEAEIFASRGYGYVSIENREEVSEKEVGYIDVDSMFTPIQAVKINIENVRVGQMTDWDKLIIDIATDGTIGYQDAFKQAVDILVEQFSFLQVQADDSNAEDEKEKKKSKKAAKKSKDTEKNEAEETVEESESSGDK